MEPILSKPEISDLLSAIKAGKVPIDIDEDISLGHCLACEPINLFEIGQWRDEQARIPNFDIILDTFCRNYSISLTNQLQRTFSISRTSLATCQYQDYLSRRKAPGAIGLLNLPPLMHNALMVLDRKLSFSMIEVMLGASAELDPLQLERELTTIELNIIKTVITEACTNLDKAFKPLIDLTSQVFKIEGNSRMISITEPESEVLVGTFLVKVDDLSGEVDLVFPLLTLDPLRDKLRELLTVNVTTRESWQGTLENVILNMDVEIVAQSGTLSMPIESILGFKKGDVLALDYDINAPLSILVEDQVKYYARPGTSNGKKAISIT